jgi:CRISPR-associated endonuclease Cas2
MFVIAAYDVNVTSEKGKTRLRKVAKECVNYVQRVQNSVFEINLDYGKFLQDRLINLIDPDKDCLRFCYLGDNLKKRVEHIGVKPGYEMRYSMAVSNIKASFQCSIQKAWDVVTSLENYLWRSDINKIEILNDNQFVEYSKDGFATTFTTTAMEPLKRWEFDMKNDNMDGHWIGLFSQNGSVTTIDFTENVTAKKLLIKPFVKAYLKKQQSTYVADLKRALSQ